MQSSGDPREEYAAATSAAAFFDWNDHATIELAGADRVAFLHNFCTNDVKRLAVGQGCEAFVTNVKGRILGHVWIEASDKALRLDAGPVAVDRLLAHLERYIINEDVTIADRTMELGQLLVTGPSAPNAILPLFGEVERLGPLQHVDVDSAMGPIQVSRRDVGLRSGYVVCAQRGALAQVSNALLNAGVRPGGADTWSALRIEAGLPVYGVDLTDDNLAQEAGRTQTAISFTKGCYLGQEPIARLDAMGHVNRELRSLRISGSDLPQPGSRVFSDAGGAAPVGTVTSSAFSFGSDSAVALALVRASVAAPGMQVFVEAGTSKAPASVFWFPTERGT
jgi:folate-binding protein YgfZ